MNAMGESLTQFLKRMKLLASITATAVVGASLVTTAVPSYAQAYGSSSIGFNKRTQQGYGNRNNPYGRHGRVLEVNPHRKTTYNLYTYPRRSPSSQTIDYYMRKK